MIRNLLSVYVLAHSGFVIGCCPMADSELILELMFLHIRGWLFSYGGTFLGTNLECAKTYTDDNFRIIGQARSSFHLGVL